MLSHLIAHLDRQIARCRAALADDRRFIERRRTPSPMKYLMCHEPSCMRGYELHEWTPMPGVAAVDADPATTPLRHRQCPRGHGFVDPESWQDERQYQQDRAHEAELARLAAQE